jgi:hypothetical protein
MQPVQIARGPDGSIHVADFSGFRIRRINPEGIISTYAGNGDSSSAKSE